jgi:hypothetical protein
MNHQLNENPDQLQRSSETDIRVNLIGTIWMCATGMLGISIPLVAISHSTLIPFTVIVGATVSTAAIWLGKGAGGEQRPDSSKIAQEQLKELEERLANIEAISLLERRLMDRDVATRLPETQSVGQQAMEVPRH